MRRLKLSFAALFVCGAVVAVGQPPERVVIGYIYSPNRPLVPTDVAAEKLTHINYAFANIKPTDPVIVGMFPKYSDQVKENTEMVRKILAG